MPSSAQAWRHRPRQISIHRPRRHKDQTGVDTREVPGAYRDFIVLFISSQIGQAVPDFDVILDRAHPAFDHSGLKTASVFRIAKIAALSEALLGGTLGRLEGTVFSEIIRRLTRLLATGQSSSSAREGSSGGP